jgi:hypothetical protein
MNLHHSSAISTFYLYICMCLYSCGVRGEIPQMPTSSQIGLKRGVCIRGGNCICERNTSLR